MPIKENQTTICNSHNCSNVGVHKGPFGRLWCLHHSHEYLLLMTGREINYPRLEVNPHLTINSGYDSWYRWCRDIACTQPESLKAAIRTAQELHNQIFLKN